MPRETNLEKLVVEFYTLLGHQVERVNRLNDYTADLTIKSSNGERWVARCVQREQVDNVSVQGFLQVLQIEKAKQATIITIGVFALEVRQSVKGNPIYLLDGSEFHNNLSRARLLAEQQRVSSSEESVPSKDAGQVKTAISRPEPPQSEQGQAAPIENVPAKLKPCPYCAEMIQEAAIVCRFCGRDLKQKAELKDRAKDDRNASLELQINQYIDNGYRIQWRDSKSAQLVKPKSWSAIGVLVFVIALPGVACLCNLQYGVIAIVVGFLFVAADYALRKDDVVTLE